MSNWETQIADHFDRDSLTYHVYYGTGRNATAEYMQRFDVVLTTYQTVMADFPSGGVPVKTKVEHDIDDDITVAEPAKKKKKTSIGELFSIKWKVSLLRGNSIPE